jgi:uncharacterized protein (DUF58 family)
MPFSNRFVILLFTGIIPIVLGEILGLSLIAFILYNLTICILLIVDLVITPSVIELEAKRVCDEKFSLGVDNTVVISIRNNGKKLIKAFVKDEVPFFLDTKGLPLQLTIPPHQESEVNYTIMPKKRGEYSLGWIHIKYNGVMGLCQKYGKIDNTKRHKVYPNLKDLSRNDFRNVNKNLLLSGPKRVKIFGLGTEFESLREYNNGDEYRRINWLATARVNKLIVNNYEPEKNQQIFILIDSGRVMNSELYNIKKLDYVINASLMLVDAALKRGDNTGIMVFDDKIRRFIKPGKGQLQFQLIADNLYNIEENLVSSDYMLAMKYLSTNQKRRALVCIFTEFFTRDEALKLKKSINTYLKHHLPLIISIKDLRIQNTSFKDIENEDDIYNKGAAIKFMEEREAIKKIFRDSNMACIDVPPDKLSVEVVNRYIYMKGKV